MMAFLGPGGGIFSMALVMFFFGLTSLEANATRKLPWIMTVIISNLVFAFAGLIDYIPGFVVLTGMLLGGHLGAVKAVEKGDRFVKIALMLVATGLAIKLLLF